MTNALAHRGPDGEGVFNQHQVGLGHRRLSIIDLGGGAQPIGNEDQSKQIVFNGEIYNFLELRIELQAFGHIFSTNSDTEVIIHAFEQWGRDCVSHLNGMFSFAIWDSANRELFLARDHLGIKPLYYTKSGNILLFGSEIKAILAYPNVERRIDLDSLAELFTFRYVPSPKTLFRNILKVPPGHTMHVSSEGFKIERFWRFVPGSISDASEGELIEEYQALLEDTVRLQMRSDVPVGLFLSSGIDSGVLLALMSKHSNGPVRTFTIGFEDGDKTNEVDDARAIAREFGAEHSFQILTPNDYMGYYNRYMRDLEEPVGNETAAAFYFVSKLTSEKVKVALTGQGADEPWAGYDRYKGVKLSSLYSRLPKALTGSLAPLVARLPGRMERLKRGAIALAEPDVLTRLAKVYSFFSADMKAQLYKGELLKVFDQDAYGTRLALSRLQNDVRNLDPLAQILYVDTRANLPDDLLMVGDKTSMACSLEARVPFLDYRLVEFVEKLPLNMKLRGMTGKYLHKKACMKWLPKSVVYRKKKGFANPVEEWFRHKMRDFVEDCLLQKSAFSSQYFNQGYIKRILELDRSGKEQYRRHIYLLVSLELWHKEFLRN